MRTRVVLALSAALMLLISLAAIGSNMGFKITIAMPASVAKYISLPYYVTLDGNPSPTAANLRNEIVAAAGGSAACTVYNWTGTTWQRWSGGGLGQTNFLLTAGTGYQVVAGQACNLVVVGSHNPSATVSLPASVAKYVAPPYHSTDATAAAFRNELIAAAGGSAACTVYNWTGTTWQRWSGGGLGQVNFTVAPGTAYQVVLSQATGWTPAHY